MPAVFLVTVPAVLITSRDETIDRHNVMAAAWSMPVEFETPAYRDFKTLSVQILFFPFFFFFVCFGWFFWWGMNAHLSPDAGSLTGIS